MRRGSAERGGEGAGVRVHVLASGICGRVIAHFNSRVLVDGRLHLFEEVVHLLEVLLGAKVRHGREVVVLGERMMGGGHAEGVRRLSHVLSRETSRVKAQGSVERHQSTTN